MNRTQGFGGCRVAGKYDERTALRQQPLYALQGVTVHSIKAAGAVRRPGIVAEVEVVVLRQVGHQLAQHRKAAVTGIENTDGRQGKRVWDEGRGMKNCRYGCSLLPACNEIDRFVPELFTMGSADKNFDELRETYPDEWLLLGNPQIKDTAVLGGEVLYHSKDKKEVCYIGRDKTANYSSVTIAYTGDLKKRRTIGIMRRL